MNDELPKEMQNAPPPQRCPFCKRQAAITQYGDFYKHRRVSSQSELCEGSGKPADKEALKKHRGFWNQLRQKLAK